MSNFNLDAPFTRRRALALGASVAGGFIATATLGKKIVWADDTAGSAMTPEVIHRVEEIIQAEGNGLQWSFHHRDRPQRHHRRDVTRRPIDPAFEMNGNIVFQSANGTSTLAAMNADMALKPERT